MRANVSQLLVLRTHPHHSVRLRALWRDKIAPLQTKPTMLCNDDVKVSACNDDVLEVLGSDS